MANVLVIDDEEGVRSFLAEALESVGHQVTKAADGRAGLECLAGARFHVVVTDLRMPEVGGLAVLAHVRAQQPEVEVIVVTAHGSVESAVEAMKAGAFDYLQKPLSGPAEVRLVIGRAAERHRLRANLEVAARADEPALGHGAAAMVEVEHALRRVAPTEATVLLLGESGTGKEVAARAIHRASARARGPFVAINCAALSEALLESELFGHEKGAFTGAVERKRGRLELAEGGTFFLDEIGELKPALQAKLLRVLQERRFERVGGHQTVDADVRWIAATNQDLDQLLADGRFREDLFHRLAVFPLRLPPLRERREDILPLAEVLLARVGAALGKGPLSLDPAAHRTLTEAAWPGNVRELANALERAAIMATGTILTEADFAFATRTTGTRASTGTLEELEREAIRAALEQAGGNRKRAADRLGIGLRTLYEKLKRYDLS